MKILEDEYEKPDGTWIRVKKIDAVKLCWKLYIPATISGIITIAAILGCNHIHIKRNAALVGAYTIADGLLKEYQKKVVETIGENKELKIRDAINQDRVIANPPNDNSIINTGNGNVLCYDPLSGRYFKSDCEFIRRAFNDLNREMLRHDGYGTLNELYYALGLPEIDLGSQLGWNIVYGELIEERFTATVTDKGEPCIVLNYNVGPASI